MTKVSRLGMERLSVRERRQEIHRNLLAIYAPRELADELLDVFENFYRHSDMSITRIFLDEDRNKLLELTVFCDALLAPNVAE